MTLRIRPLALAGALLLAPTMLAACSSGTDDATASASTTASASASAGNATAPLPTGGAELANTSWRLSGASYTTDDLTGFGITLEFAAAEASGNAGVNTYSGGYTSTPEGTLTFSALASTLVAGDEKAMAAEAAYLKALGTVTGYSVSGGLLDLFAGPDQVLTFTQG